MNFNYHPEGLYVWDTWYFHHQGRTHCIHLQQPRPGNKRSLELYGALGHAVTDDLVKWTELPPVLYRGEPGSYDDLDLWTGCTIYHQGLFYMFYTARSSHENGLVNRICLATSTDGIKWERHPNNPIITPDPRWYCAEGSPLPVAGHAWHMIDCRDLVVVFDSKDKSFYGFYAARIPATECAASSVIACCKSLDLIHWEHLPPCFVPEKYACIEVPDVFQLDGRWYLTCLTGNSYGQRNRLSDTNLHMGTIYAVAEDPTGPYHELDENVLFGSVNWQGFSARTVAIDGKRYLFYTQSEEMDGSPWGTITTPKILRTDKHGHLLACYAPHIEKYAGDALLSGPHAIVENEGQWGSLGAWNTKEGEISGTCRTDWSLCIFDVSAESFIATVAVKILDARSAGVVFRVQGEDVLGGAYVVLLDAQAQQVIFTQTRDFPCIELRQWEIKREKTYNLRIVAKNSIFEVFIDDVLVLQLYHSLHRSGHLGLFVEEGTAEFSHLHVVSLMG